MGIEVFDIANIIYDMNTGKKRMIEEQVQLLNKINLENKEWIIEGDIIEDLDFLFNLGSEIIFGDYDYFQKSYWKRLFCWKKEGYIRKKFAEKMGKYSSRLIILRNKKEVKKLLKAYEESYKY